MNAWTIAGTLASFVGVVVGIWTLLTARGARKAAKNAAREASEMARQRNLLEELEAAHSKAVQVGIFLLNRDLGVVRLRAVEILNACSGAAIRWKDTLSESSRNDLVKAGELAHSVASGVEELRVVPGETTSDRYKRIDETHLRVAKLIGRVLAEARKKAERGKT